MNTNNNSGWLNLAAGWLKENQKGQQFISCKGGDQRSGLQLFAKTQDGQTYEVTNFIVSFVQDKKNEKYPDVQISMKLE
jgi:uncharacterized protein (DUF736 family)